MCLYTPLPLIKVSWFFLFVWFCTRGTTLLDKIAFPLWGEKPGFHILSRFYWVHDKLSAEITQGSLPTLYRPKSPRSRSTFTALTLGPVVISPATCRRIFTISSGLVKMTWEPPACRQGRRDRSRFLNQRPTGALPRKIQESLSTAPLYSSLFIGEWEARALADARGDHRDGPKPSFKPIYVWVCFDLKCQEYFSNQSFQGQPSHIQNGKTNKRIWKTKVKPDEATGSSPTKGKEMVEDWLVSSGSWR